MRSKPIAFFAVLLLVAGYSFAEIDAPPRVNMDNTRVVLGEITEADEMDSELTVHFITDFVTDTYQDLTFKMTPATKIHQYGKSLSLDDVGSGGWATVTYYIDPDGNYIAVSVELR
jgi:hypothetical protein